MHRKMRQLEICIFTFMLSLASLTRAQAGEPLDLVRAAVDKAIQTLKDPKLQSQDKKKERIDRLREALNPIFDYEEMAKRALGTIGGGGLRPSRRSLLSCFGNSCKESTRIRSISMAANKCGSAARSWIRILPRSNRPSLSPRAKN